VKKLLLFCVALVGLAGCTTTVPVTAKFPEAPEILLVECDKLDKIGKDKVYFSDFLKTVVGNYGKYHNCKKKYLIILAKNNDSQLVVYS
jgi:hypothetical protein